MSKHFSLFSALLLVALLAAACGSGRPAPRIGDFVWVDRDRDGIQDAGEEGLQGVDVKLYTFAESLLASTTSDQDGWYGFTDVPAGDYYLEFSAPVEMTFHDEYGEVIEFRYIHLTIADQGVDDAVDSDPDPETGRTAVFSLPAAGGDTSLDAGFYVLTAVPTPTDTPEPSSTPPDDGGGGNGGGGDDGEKKAIEVGPTDDAYVVTTQAESNYGAENSFYLWGRNCYVYMSFPLNDIPAGTHIPYANLHLMIHPNSTAQGLKIWINMVNPGYIWNQNQLTWKNSPSPDPTAPQLLDAVLGSYTGEGAEDVFDVTALVQHAVDHGYTAFQVILGTDTMSDEHSQEWYSTESGKTPVLEIDP